MLAWRNFIQTRSANWVEVTYLFVWELLSVQSQPNLKKCFSCQLSSDLHASYLEDFFWSACMSNLCACFSIWIINSFFFTSLSTILWLKLEHHDLTLCACDYLLAIVLDGWHSLDNKRTVCDHAVRGAINKFMCTKNNFLERRWHNSVVH